MVVIISAVSTVLLLVVTSLPPSVSAKGFDLHFSRYVTGQVKEDSGFAVHDVGRCSTKSLGQQKLKQDKCRSWPGQTPFDQYMFVWARANPWLGIKSKYGHGNCSIEVYVDTDCKGELAGLLPEANRLRTGRVCHPTYDGKAAQSAKIVCHPWPYKNWWENEENDYSKQAKAEEGYYPYEADNPDEHFEHEVDKGNGTIDAAFDGTTDNINEY